MDAVCPRASIRSSTVREGGARAFVARSPLGKVGALATAFATAFEAAFLVGCAGFLVGCAGTGERPDDVLVVWSDMANPPFSSWSSSWMGRRPVGIEVDILDDAARRLGKRDRWVQKPFTELIPGVVDGDADVAASTIGITPERAELVAFSRPYFRTEIVAVVRDVPDGPRSLADLTGMPVGAGRGTTAVAAARQAIRNPDLVLEEQDGMGLDELLARGRIDAVVLDAPAALRMIEEADVPLRRLDAPLGEEAYAFAVAHGSPRLLAAIDAAIRRHGEAAERPAAP